jgi:hypothetical protein
MHAYNRGHFSGAVRRQLRRSCVGVPPAHVPAPQLVPPPALQGDWGPPYGGGRKRGGRGGRGRGASSKAAEPTEEELQQMAEEVEAEAMEEEGDGEGVGEGRGAALEHTAEVWGQPGAQLEPVAPLVWAAC